MSPKLKGTLGPSRKGSGLESDGNITNEDRLPDYDETHNQDMDELPNAEEEETNTGEIYDDYIEDPYEQPITIDNMLIVTEINTSQLAVQQEEEQNVTNQTPTIITI